MYAADSATLIRPGTLFIATGEYHTVLNLPTCFQEAGIDLRWEGEGVNEKGIDTATGKVLVEVDPNISARQRWNNYWRSYQSQNVVGMESPQDFIRGTGENQRWKHDMKFVRNFISKQAVKSLVKISMEKSAKNLYSRHHGLRAPLFGVTCKKRATPT